jgi:hypothetical protein
MSDEAQRGARHAGLVLHPAPGHGGHGLRPLDARAGKLRLGWPVVPPPRRRGGDSCGAAMLAAAGGEPAVQARSTGRLP